MVHNDGKPQFYVGGFFVKGFKAALLLELGGILVSYSFYRRLNRNQDFRLYMYKNHNWVLEGYYQAGEFISGDTTIRDVDLACWQEAGKI